MRKLYMLLILFLMVSNTIAQWVQQNSGTQRGLYSVDFPETLIGYAVGDSGIFLKTSDAGENWEISQYGLFAGFQSVFFDDALIGYQAGSGIRKTTNGGISWINQYGSAFGSTNSIYFPCSDTGYAVGVGYNGVGNFANILKTSNGGSEWLNSQQGWPNGAYTSVHFVNNNTGFVVGGWYEWYTIPHPHLQKTSDGGQTWIILDSLFQSETIFNSVYFCTAETGYIVGTDGTIFKTADGGLNWNSQTSGIFSDLNDVFFINEDLGYIAGDSGIILKTLDGGEIWFTEYSGTTDDLHSIDFPCPDTGFIVGENGKILRNTDCGPTSINSIKHSDNRLKIYPNPTSSSLNIELSFKPSPDAYLTISNLNGQDLIERRLFQSPIIVNINYLAPGIYILIVKDKDFMCVQKLVVN